MIPRIVSIDNNRQRKILGEIHNVPMKLYPNLYLMFAKIFGKFFLLFEQLISCSLQDDMIEIMLQIQYHFIHVNASCNGSSQREGYVEGEYMDAGGICQFYKTSNVFTKDVFEIVTHRQKKSRVEKNGVNHGLKTLTNENKDDIIGKRGVLNVFYQIKINSTSKYLIFIKSSR